MLKIEVREMVKYLIGERKSFKVVFANDTVEVVEYRGYCWVMSGKGYSDEELIEKMVRFQNNEKKFIIKFEEIEEVVEEVAVEESLVEEVENLTDDLFQESDIAYAEEAIERETHKKENDKMKTNIEVRIYVDLDVILETIYSEAEIKRRVMEENFNDFTFNEMNILKLADGTEVRVFPHFNIYNDLILTVSYF